MACCCALLGQSTFAAQEEIVRQYPDELSAGTENEGMTVSLKGAARVLVGLGLARHVRRLMYSETAFEKPAQFLRVNKQLAGQVFLVTHHPSDHCMLICEIFSDGIKVMDPSAPDFGFLSWEQLRERRVELTILEK